MKVQAVLMQDVWQTTSSELRRDTHGINGIDVKLTAKMLCRLFIDASPLL